ncbi:MAG: hypothetical protein ABFC67_05265 [Mizugakiibacter sp.]|uniref:hypothetical protein n=1 Tax=Mizugakiibacter sp. TaxID=1972610 RepID=UPI0031C8FF22|nr:hypothetical protein [Xanthomonadaceae bacterium]
MSAALVRRLRRLVRWIARAYAPLAARGALFDGRADAGAREAAVPVPRAPPDRPRPSVRRDAATPRRIAA